MNRIDDDRVLFYLRHQERIEEWAALGKEVTDIAHRFLCSCEDEVASLAAEIGPGVEFVPLLQEGYPKLFLCRSGWFSNEKGKKYPRCAVGLEWLRSGVRFSGQGKTAYAGVWVHYQMDGGPALHAAASQRLRAAGLLKEQGIVTSRMWWPAYHWVPAQDEYWKDLAPYRARLVGAVRRLWENCEPILSELAS